MFFKDNVYWRKTWRKHGAEKIQYSISFQNIPILVSFLTLKITLHPNKSGKFNMLLNWASVNLLNKVPRVPECLECPSALILKCPNCLSAQAPECPPSALWVPECSSALRVSKCLIALQEPSKCSSALRVTWILECPLSIFKCALCACMLSNQMWFSNQMRRFWGAKFWSRNRALIWKTSGISYKNFIFVRIEFCFLFGHLIMNFRLALNKKHFFEVSFKRMRF